MNLMNQCTGNQPLYATEQYKKLTKHRDVSPTKMIPIRKQFLSAVVNFSARTHFKQQPIS